eukprot:148539-Chlamydomonas_euryale.AAC.4
MNSVVYVSSELRRTRRLSLGGALSKQRLNSDVKYERLYWYMGSTIACAAGGHQRRAGVGLQEGLKSGAPGGGLKTGAPGRTEGWGSRDA